MVLTILEKAKAEVANENSLAAVRTLSQALQEAVQLRNNVLTQEVQKLQKLIESIESTLRWLEKNAFEAKPTHLNPMITLAKEIDFAALRTLARARA